MLNALTFGLLIVGIKGLDDSQHTALVAAELGGALVLGYFLIRRQLSQDAPLLPVDLLKLPVFALSVVTSVCSFGAQSIAYVSLPFYFQDVIGRSQGETGLLMTPWPLAHRGHSADLRPAGGSLTTRDSGGHRAWACWRWVWCCSPCCRPTRRWPIFAGGWRVCGLGFGLFQSPNNKVLIYQRAEGAQRRRQRDPGDGPAAGPNHGSGAGRA